jgi:hypothetical protein
LRPLGTRIRSIARPLPGLKGRAATAQAKGLIASHEKKVIKDRDGNPMTLYPLVLGVEKEKDAAEFQTIFFSGKRLGTSADTRNETRDQNWHIHICTPMC